MRLARRLKLLDPQDLRADPRSRMERIFLAELLAHHEPHEPGNARVSRGEGLYLAPIAQDRDPFTHLEQLLEPMRDVEDRHPAGLEAGDDPEQALDLGRRQRRGRLVDEIGRAACRGRVERSVVDGYI